MTMTPFKCHVRKCRMVLAKGKIWYFLLGLNGRLRRGHTFFGTVKSILINK